MFGHFKVYADSANLSDYRQELIKSREKMNNDIGILKSAYAKAEWNDIVAEKTRIELNKYIDNYNLLMKELNSVISAISEMCDELDNYENELN